MKTRIEFDEQLQKTGMLHWRMEVDEADSLEWKIRSKPVDKTCLLWDGRDLESWRKEGLGSLSLSDGGLLLKAPSRSEAWPAGSPEDGDYCAFGSLDAHLSAPLGDWRPYNRLHFQIRPDCRGMHSPMIAMQLYNDGEEKIPDRYCREGYHTIHLKNNQWNDCVWEFPSLPRDHVTSFAFIVHCYGKELSMDDTLRYLLKDIRLEHTPEISHTLGWQTDADTVVCSTGGYWSDGPKSAVSSTKTGTFQLCDPESKMPVYTGVPRPVTNEKGTFYLWDFSGFDREGTYFLRSGSIQSPPFTISPHPLYQSVWKVLHFLYCERCGYPVGRGHGTCHGDILAVHNGVKLAYCGGWHDAGDVSQQTLQSAEVVHSLLEMACRIRKEEPQLYWRLLEEAVWGLDFVLRMRFGDGYRATSAGIRRFSDGLIGNMDDCDARVHNHAFENFMMAGVEAFASRVLAETDHPLSQKAFDAACEDYRFARAHFAKEGMELPSFYEHSYGSSLSLYWAAASWAASQIYACKGEPAYAGYAAEYARLMLSCQETGNTGAPLSGFFYRDPDRRSIVHFNHQSREQLFMQALEALCQTQPSGAERPKWEASMKRYGDYLKGIYSYSMPYGMLPAGIHKTDEYLDQETFPLLHLMTTWQEDHANYKKQLSTGIALDENYCLRHFPVWFSFRGNTAVHLASGKAASILGRYFKDDDLIRIARDQLYWTFGKNPFGQSLVYGAGSNFAQQYGALNGEMAGSIPVGIETRGNEDIPFWPMENNATYKEVWTTSARCWLQLAADVY
jgi:hypothetical protein